jgi:hypothetical protein
MTSAPSVEAVSLIRDMNVISAVTTLAGCRRIYQLRKTNDFGLDMGNGGAARAGLLDTRKALRAR